MMMVSNADFLLRSIRNKYYILNLILERIPWNAHTGFALSKK